ncbi:MAG TPA: adenylate/guanylate cyclase domain-containing protein, partial [Anaerolineae bacterium]|nr:adenylate/guanylate cyclase domain-containing protein [Anaerolineae bacterium]
VAGVAMERIGVAALGVAEVEALVGDMCRLAGEVVRPLAELVVAKTDGNPFFIRAFLQSLYQQKLLWFQGGRWRWDLEAIQVAEMTDNVVTLMADNVRTLPAETQVVLRWAACLGNQFGWRMLTRVYGASPQATAAALWPAVTAGYVVPLDRDYKLANLMVEGVEKEIEIRYKFGHDRIQQAAYSLIDERERGRYHRHVGTILQTHLQGEERKKRLFDIVNQLNMGRDKVEGSERWSEPGSLVNLNFLAGKKAQAAAAYEPALVYYRVCLELSGDDLWRRDYDKAMLLYVSLAEAAYLSGELAAMEGYVGVILAEARDVLGKVKAYEVKIQAHIAQNELMEAIETALPILEELGVKFPAKPGRGHVLIDLVKTRWALRGKKAADLAELPVMEDAQTLAIIRITSLIFSPAFRVSPGHFPLFVMRVIRLSLAEGNAALSAFAYACYGLILCGILKRIDEGYAFGELAKKVLAQFEAEALKARTYMVTAGFVTHWKEPLDNALALCEEGYRSGLAMGDFEFACYNGYVWARYAYVKGMPLAELAPQVKVFHEMTMNLEQTSALHLTGIYRQLIANLRGEGTGEPTMLMGESYNEEKMLPIHLEVMDRNALHNFYLCKMMLAYMVERYDEAYPNIALEKQYLEGGRGSSGVAQFYFYSSLILIERYGRVGSEEQRVLAKEIKENQKLLTLWTTHAPTNYEHMYKLVMAEWARVKGEEQLAAALYDEAIELAQAAKFLHVEGHANELAGRFYFERGRMRLAGVYLAEARYAYLRWGAKIKVALLDEAFGELFREGKRPLAATTTTNSSVTRGGSVVSQTGTGQGASLDVETMMKASRVISGEIKLETLLQKLMGVVLENAGGQRGVLLLAEEKGWLLAVAGDVKRMAVEMVALGEGAGIVPLGVVNYVQRTQAAVVLDDVGVEGDFQQDEYIVREKPKAVMCVPLLNQGKLLGVIYVENRLTAGAFTPARVRLVGLLAAQAGISLENARLYENLEGALAKQTALTKGYSRFVPPEVLRILGKGDITEVVLGDQIQQEMTVMFADIRGFTALSEQMTPQENFNFINDYLSQVSPVIRQNGGFIDKYIGDEIMALFPEGIGDGVATAVAIQREVGRFNERMRAEGLPEIKVGISLHHGLVMLGTVGEEERLEGTVISDAVNVASRLEGVNKELGTKIVISGEALALLGENGGYETREVGAVEVKGKKKALSVFEILG